MVLVGFEVTIPPTVRRRWLPPGAGLVVVGVEPRSIRSLELRSKEKGMHGLRERERNSQPGPATHYNTSRTSPASTHKQAPPSSGIQTQVKSLSVYPKDNAGILPVMRPNFSSLSRRVDTKTRQFNWASITMTATGKALQDKLSDTVNKEGVYSSLPPWSRESYDVSFVSWKSGSGICVRMWFFYDK